MIVLQANNQAAAVQHRQDYGVKQPCRASWKVLGSRSALQKSCLSRQSRNVSRLKMQLPDSHSSDQGSEYAVPLVGHLHVACSFSGSVQRAFEALKALNGSRPLYLKSPSPSHMIKSVDKTEPSRWCWWCQHFGHLSCNPIQYPCYGVEGRRFG